MNLASYIYFNNNGFFSFKSRLYLCEPEVLILLLIFQSRKRWACFARGHVWRAEYLELSVVQIWAFLINTKNASHIVYIQCLADFVSNWWAVEHVQRVPTLVMMWKSSLAGQPGSFMCLLLLAADLASTFFLQIPDNKCAESLCCHRLFTAKTKNMVCKISGAGKIRNICWDREQLVAWEPCSRRPETHQFCPCLLLFLQLMLVVGDIFARYRTN